MFFDWSMRISGQRRMMIYQTDRFFLLFVCHYCESNRRKRKKNPTFCWFTRRNISVITAAAAQMCFFYIRMCVQNENSCWIAASRYHFDPIGALCLLIDLWSFTINIKSIARRWNKHRKYPKPRAFVFDPLKFYDLTFP